jgi:hypothetical protein
VRSSQPRFSSYSIVIHRVGLSQITMTARDSCYTLAQCSFAPHILLAWLPRLSTAPKQRVRVTPPLTRFEPIWTSLSLRFSFGSMLCSSVLFGSMRCSVLCILQHIDPTIFDIFQYCVLRVRFSSYSAAGGSFDPSDSAFFTVTLLVLLYCDSSQPFLDTLDPQASRSQRSHFLIYH